MLVTTYEKEIYSNFAETRVLFKGCAIRPSAVTFHRLGEFFLFEAIRFQYFKKPVLVTVIRHLLKAGLIEATCESIPRPQERDEDKTPVRTVLVLFGNRNLFGATRELNCRMAQIREFLPGWCN